MAEFDLFGEKVLTKEELKAQKEEEKKAKEQEVLKAKKEAEEARNLESLREKVKDTLTELDEKTYPDLMNDIDSIDEASKADLTALKTKYKDAFGSEKKESSNASGKKYKFPFLMYFGHEYRDVSHMFEDGKEYYTDEITKILAEHGYKEFKVAPTVEYEYFEDENCLFPKFKVGNRG